MKEKWTPHIIAVLSFVVFIVLGLACASTPETNESEVVYLEIPFSELREKINQAKTTQGFIVEAYIIRTPRSGHSSFELVSSPSDKEGISISTHEYSTISTRVVSNHANSQQIDRFRYDLRFDENKLYRIYICAYDAYQDGRIFAHIDKIEGLLDDHVVIAAKEQVEREAAEAARRQEKIERAAAEQERLTNLYRQAGNNFGNLRNTSRRYAEDLAFVGYTITTYNFGDGDYILESRSPSLGAWGTETTTGTYRVNGDTVIFLSSKGEYSYGTIVGTALRIGNTVYR